MQRDIDDVEALLDLWAEDMRRFRNDAAGYPSEASGGFICTWRKDSQESAEEHDRSLVEAVDAAYDSLSAIFRDAINRHYRLGADVWIFPRKVDFDEAKAVIRVKFVQRGLL